MRQHGQIPIFDMYEAAGSRLPFLILYPYGYDRQQGVYITDFFREGYIDGLPDLEDNQSYDAIHNLWMDIDKCCRQAETMMALQPSYARALAIHKTHSANLVKLFNELKKMIQRADVKFAET